MKKIILSFFYLNIGLFILLFVSCKKEHEQFGIPSGTMISSIKAPDIAIQEGNMGDWIALHGTNFSNIQDVHFNDVKVVLKDVYVDNNIIYLQIPVKMPSNITNQILVETHGGKYAFDFKVNIPNLELTRMHNEYTAPGDTIRIYGRFFDLYEIDASNAIVKFGDLEAPVINRTNTYITAKVPELVPANVKVKLKSLKYNAEATCLGYYQDKNYVITSFDKDFPYTGPRATAVGQWDVPKPTSGNYMKFEVDQATHPNGLGWFYMMENKYTYQLDMVHHPEKYELKFELNMRLPIRQTKFFIYYLWSANPIGMGGEVFNVQNLGTWQTVSIPLEKILPVGYTGSTRNFNLNFRVENFSPVERLAMYFDNFRIYKKGE